MPAFISSCMATREAGLCCGPQHCTRQAHDGGAVVQLSNNMAAAGLDFTWPGQLMLQHAKAETKSNAGPATCCSTARVASAGQVWTSLQQAVACSAVMPRLCLVK